MMAATEGMIKQDENLHNSNFMSANVSDLLTLEVMAAIDENAFGSSLVNILKIRKELSKRALQSGLHDEQELKQLYTTINYYNSMICKIIGIPYE